LHLIGEAKQPGMSPTLSIPQEAKGAVVKAASHAKPIANLVKSDQWRNHDIKSYGPQQGFPCWFGNSESIGHQKGIAAIAAKKQRLSLQDRQVDFAAAIPGSADQPGAIDLAIYGQVSGNAPGTLHQRQLPGERTGGMAGLAGKLRGQGASLANELGAQFRAVHEGPASDIKSGSSRLCRDEPSPSNQGDRWGQPRQIRLSAKGGRAQYCLQTTTPV